MAERIAPGTQVKWTSHGAGGAKSKSGEVVGFIPGGKKMTDLFPQVLDVPKTRVKAGLPWGDTSGYDRYLVAVPRGGKSTLVDYYAPCAKWLEK